MNIYNILSPFILVKFLKLARCVNHQSSLFPFGMVGSRIILTSKLFTHPHVNIRNTVMSGIQDLADFAVNIHPPQEDPEETLKSLDGIMMLENAQRRADNEEFTEAEQRLLKIHRNKIREIVSSAFEPIHAMFPSRMEALIRNGN